MDSALSQPVALDAKAARAVLNEPALPVPSEPRVLPRGYQANAAVLKTTAEIVVAYVRSTRVSAAELPNLIRRVLFALMEPV